MWTLELTNPYTTLWVHPTTAWSMERLHKKLQCVLSWRGEFSAAPYKVLSQRFTHHTLKVHVLTPEPWDVNSFRICPPWHVLWYPTLVYSTPSHKVATHFLRTSLGTNTSLCGFQSKSASHRLMPFSYIRNYSSPDHYTFRFHQILNILSGEAAK